MRQSELTAAEYRAGLVLTRPDGVQRARQKSGEDTEARVASLNAACVRAGLAVRIDKIPTPYRRVGRGARGGQFIGVPTERSTVDYVGQLAGGRALWMEVKRCTGTSLPFARIETHQRTALQQAHDGGGLALVLVLFGAALATATVCVVPWRDLAARIAAGSRKSLSADELRRWSIAPGALYLTAPWVVP
jgi:penicillin-binding protein-related factor A (putative recombinase)